MSIADLRKEYQRHTLDETHVAKDPIEQFHHWFEESRQAEILEPNAMILATSNSAGVPSARVLLLKAADERGFTFFTNYNSRKGNEIAENPVASMVFFWKELERQVRIEGKVEKVSREESEAYFNSRPFNSRLGAIASEQSQTIQSRIELEEKMEELKKLYQDTNPPIPPHWGGYLLRPLSVEFWQGRPSRLHDRLVFRRKELDDVSWTISRLAP